MNVSKAADAAFMRELQRTDPARYARLIRAMEREAGRVATERKQEQAQTVLLKAA